MSSELNKIINDYLINFDPILYPGINCSKRDYLRKTIYKEFMKANWKYNGLTKSHYTQEEQQDIFNRNYKIGNIMRFISKRRFKEIRKYCYPDKYK